MEETYQISLACKEYLGLIGHLEITLLAEIESVWVSVVGEDVARNVFPLKLDHETLVLGTSNPSWVTHLKFMNQDILNRLREALENKSTALRPGQTPSKNIKIGNAGKSYMQQPIFPTRIKTIVKR